MVVVRAAIGVLVVLTLTGCAGEQFSLGSSAPALAPDPVDDSMPGRWILSAPNAPSCGLEFGGAAGARAGSVAPDGGCPGNFYMSRRWAIEGSALTITGQDSQLLAQLKVVGTHFEGQSNVGTPVTLSR
jgi:protease inhibitor Inh